MVLYGKEEKQMKDDVIIVGDNKGGHNRKNFYFYYRGELDVCSISNTLVDAKAMTKALNSCVSGKERFWLILSKQLRSSEQFNSFFLDTKHEGFHLELEKKFHRLSLYFFEVTSH